MGSTSEQPSNTCPNIDRPVMRPHKDLNVSLGFASRCCATPLAQMKNTSFPSDKYQLQLQTNCGEPRLRWDLIVNWISQTLTIGEDLHS